MSFIALYAENASVVGTYAERAAAVRAAVRIAMRRPDLSTDIGIAELDDGDGHVIAPFVSASDLLANDDSDAVAAAEAAADERRGETRGRSLPDEFDIVIHHAHGSISAVTHVKSSSDAESPRIDEFTLKTLRHLSNGMRTPEIAAEMGVGEEAIRQALRSAYDALLARAQERVGSPSGSA